MKVFFSNRVEKLYENLKSSLYSRGCDPFARRLIVVSNQAVKSWLMLTMAKDSELGVAAGIEIAYLEQAIDKLSQQAKTVSQVELALALEIEIRTILDSTEELWTPLKLYLKLKDGKLTRKGERRLISLADSLAHLFIQYGLYGAKMVSEWILEKPPLWQAALWRRIYDKYPWSYRSKILETAATRNESSYEVYVFSLSFLSRPHFEFLNRISEKQLVDLYILSPCQSFWSDLSFGKRLIKNEDEGNVLLMNSGRLGREMAKLVEDSFAETTTDYVLPEAILENEAYNSLIFEELETESGPLTLLKSLQADILLLRNPQASPKIDLPIDDSIQIHVASSRKREIEILYDSLIQAMQKKKIEPGEVIVMVPKLMDYEPYIHTVFGNKDIPYQLLDTKFLFRSPVVQGFLHLLQLSSGRWDSISIMELFRYEVFQKCHQLTREDVDWMEDILIEVGVRWGEDETHRDVMLKRDHGLGASIKSPAGTWSYGINRILAALAVVGSQNLDESNQLEFLPSEKIEASQGLLLGKILALLHSLKDDLIPLSDGSKMNWISWCDYLKCLLTAYFGIDEESSQQNEESKCLWVWLDNLRRYGKSFKQDLFLFDTIKRHLESGLQKEDLNSTETQLNAVCFCSMLPLRAIPASKICLIGMEEGVFPRTEIQQSMNLLISRRDADYCPTQVDYDRYLFLEALISARNSLHFSYIGFDGNGKEKPPSLLVSELLSYIESGYTFRGSIPSITLNHPFYAFDKVYYTNTKFTSYSKENFFRAQAFYSLEKEKPHRFIPEFILPENSNVQSKNLDITTIDIRQLSSFARNPFKTYFNKTLGIYFSEEEELKSEEEFVLSKLDLSYMKKSALGLPLDMVIQQADKKGLLPPGTFRDVAIRKVDEELKILESNLIDCGVNPKEIFKVHLTDLVEVPIQDEKGDWHLPPFRYASIKIVGTFSEVSKQGLIFHGKDDKIDVLKTWPLFLVFQAVLEKFQIPVANQLIFAKSGKARSPWFSDVKPYLEAYIDYYLYANTHISPLLPEWTHDLMHLDAESFQRKIQESLNNDFNSVYNDYLLWLTDGSDIVISDTWKKYATGLFFDLYAKWYSKRDG